MKSYLNQPRFYPGHVRETSAVTLNPTDQQEKCLPVGSCRYLVSMPTRMDLRRKTMFYAGSNPSWKMGYRMCYMGTSVVPLAFELEGVAEFFLVFHFHETAGSEIFSECS